MGKTRCLGKYRRKSKQVKTRNKCFSKKSRIHHFKISSEGKI